MKIRKNKQTLLIIAIILLPLSLALELNLSNPMIGYGILSILIKGVICVILPNALWVLCTFKSNGFKRVRVVVKRIVKNVNN